VVILATFVGLKYHYPWIHLTRTLIYPFHISTLSLVVSQCVDFIVSCGDLQQSKDKKKPTTKNKSKMTTMHAMCMLCFITILSVQSHTSQPLLHQHQLHGAQNLLPALNREATYLFFAQTFFWNNQRNNDDNLYVLAPLPLKMNFVYLHPKMPPDW